MYKCLIICKSQTDAQQASRILSSCGVSSSIVRPPRDMMISSCTYAVKISESNLRQSLLCLKEKNFTPVSVCSLFDDGTCRRI